MGLLTKHGYQVKAIEVMGASRRTTKLNAYFTGFGKLKTIVLYDNLINAMTTDEICAVFAHELGHGLHKDVLKQQIMNFGNLLLMALVVWLAVRDPKIHEAFGFTGINYGFAYVIAGIGLALTQPVSAMVMNGDGIVQPISAHAFSIAATAFVISSSGRSLIRPAIGSGSRATSLPPLATAIPPPHSTRALATTAISSSLVPTTSRLWASWATVEAIAPSSMPKPSTKP